MEIYDITMLVILVGAGVFGAIKGFAWQLASIASIVVSYIVAYRFREPFSQSIQAEPPWNRFLAMLILYIGTALVIWVGFRMVSNTIDRLKLREFDRQIGALFGLAKGALYCILITMFAVTLLGETIRTKVVASKSGHYIASVLDKSESVIPAEIHEVVGPYLEKFDEKFAGSETQEATSGFTPLRDLAARASQAIGGSGQVPAGQEWTPPATFQPVPTPTNSGPAQPNAGAAWPSSQPGQSPTAQPAVLPPAWNAFQN